MGVCGSKDSLAGVGEMWAVMFVCIVETIILKGACHTHKRSFKPQKFVLN